MKPLITIMYGLLYPAVLGAIAYNLLPYLFHRFPSVISDRRIAGKVGIGLFIVLHFITDFAFIQEFAPDYGWRQFLLDLAVVVSLYNAFWSLRLDSIHAESADILPRRLAGWMGCVYLSFLLWTAIEQAQSDVVEHWPTLLVITATASGAFTALALRPRKWLIAGAIILFGLLETIASYNLMMLTSR